MAKQRGPRTIPRLPASPAPVLRVHTDSYIEAERKGEVEQENRYIGLVFKINGEKEHSKQTSVLKKSSREFLRLN